MRIDKYLKVTGIIKRRTVANGAADNGRVYLNGRTAKACTAVKEGDIIEIDFGTKMLKVKVLKTENLNRKESSAYEILGDENGKN